MEAYPLILVVISVVFFLVSKPFFSRSSYSWWADSFWGKESYEPKYYIYHRYIRSGGSIAITIFSLSLALDVLLNYDSELSASIIFFAEACVFLTLGVVVYFSKSLGQKIVDLTWSADNEVNDVRYIAFTILFVAAFMLFAAYLFRPIGFYF